MQDKNIKFHEYAMSVRSKATFKTDGLNVTMPACQDPAVEGPKHASGYNATVESIVLRDPVATLSAHLAESIDLLEGLAARFDAMGSPEAASFVREQLNDCGRLGDRAKIAIKFATAQTV